MKRRRHVDTTAALRTLGMARRLNRSEQTAMSVVYWAAFDDMAQGRGDETHFDSLAGAVNLALVLAERAGNNTEAIAHIQAAQDALMRARARKEMIGRFGFDGQGYSAVQTVLDLHDQQLALCTGKQMIEAMNEAIRRMRAGDVLEASACRRPSASNA
jgi:hypothetical protein